MSNKNSLDDTKAEWIGHATVKLETSNEKTIYIDPWSKVLEGNEPKADVIISTHSHFDHFDQDAIEDLRKEDTVLISSEDSARKLEKQIDTEIIGPGKKVETDGLRIDGVHAYNIDKFREKNQLYHPKGLCTGIIITAGSDKIYHASDTDPIQEMSRLWEENIDLAFVPIGGNYTMDQKEAVHAVKMIRPNNVAPIHFGTVENTEADPEKFREDIEEKTESRPVLLD